MIVQKVIYSNISLKAPKPNAFEPMVGEPPKMEGEKKLKIFESRYSKKRFTSHNCKQRCVGLQEEIPCLR